MTRPKRTPKSEAWSESRSAEDIVESVTGISREMFLARYKGRQLLLRHTPRNRWNSLLGESLISDLDGLRHMIPYYAQKIKQVVYDSSGKLGFRNLRERDREAIGQEGACYFFWDYDGHFAAPRHILDDLCDALAYIRHRSSCKAIFHMPGGGVPRHCDASDVMSLQFFGERHWKLERNSDPPSGIADPVQLPFRCRNGWSAAFGRSGVELIALPDTFLYIPSGWWHETHSEQPSFALTIALRANH
jgi:hypothetical protein